MSKDRIVLELEQHPSGLTITDLSKQIGYHRNTLSPKREQLLNDGTVKVKLIGKAKVYYLSRHEKLHKGVKMDKNKNIQVGMGVSDLEDGYKAGMEAAKQAAKKASQGEYPTFSIVFVSAKYNPQIERVVKGVNKILGKDWIGCTSDKELNSIRGYSGDTIGVLSFQTKYLHFGVSVAENYRDNPFEKGGKAILEAIERAPVDRAVDSTVQYIRSTKKSYADIVKNPPYFCLTLIGGAYYKDKNPFPATEDEFLEGIYNAVGSSIPIIGGSASSDIFEYTINRVADNYQFANGKIYSKASIVAFVVSDLYFSYGIEHGYKKTDRIALLSKVSNNGRVIEEINGKPAVEEYCRLIGVTPTDFNKKPFEYTLTNPIAALDTDGSTYIKTTGPNPDGKTLYSLTKIMENSVANILSFDEESVLNALSDVTIKAGTEHNEKDIALILIFSCSARRVVLGDKVQKTIDIFKSKHGDIPIFGMYSFGEFGS